MSAKIAILISGRGSNMVALIDACRQGRISAKPMVISNVTNAAGLDRASERKVEAIALPSRGLTRAAHEAAVIRALGRANVDLICLAGYMRLLGSDFVREFTGRILNIHPS